MEEVKLLCLKKLVGLLFLSKVLLMDVLKVNYSEVGIYYLGREWWDIVGYFI